MNIFCRRLFVLVTACLLGGLGTAQRMGIPFIRSYPKQVHGYGTQTWDIAQGEDGVIYFANNDGLVTFDGRNWTLFPLPNKTICRSLLYLDGDIYVGGQNEFGKFVRDLTNKWRYESLKTLIPEEYRNFEDVWTMVEKDGWLYFRSSGKVYAIQLAEERCHVITEVSCQFIGKADNQVFVQDEERNIYTIATGKLKKVLSGSRIDYASLQEIIYDGQDIWLFTHQNGLFRWAGQSVEPWDQPWNDKLEKLQINTASLMPDGDLIIGTSFGGLLIVDSTGQVKHQLSKTNGLSDNKVSCTLIDRNNNLWCGLDNSINFVQTNYPFTHFQPDGELEGIGYDVEVFGDKIYFGTSNGLYYSDWPNTGVNQEFMPVKNTSGQVWGLDIVGDHLILCHQNGAFLVEGNQVEPIFTKTGVWRFVQDENNPRKAVAGTYEGLMVFSLPEFTLDHSVPGFSESSRFLEYDKEGTYWVSHPYRGVYKIEHALQPPQTKVTAYGAESGLDADLHNHVFKVGNELLFCSQNKVYRYLGEQDTFEVYPEISRYLAPETKVRRLFEGPGGDIWFVTEDEVGVLNMEREALEASFEKIVFPKLKKLMNGGWERIYPHSAEDVFIATINGFLYFRNEGLKDTSASTTDVLIKEVILNKDSTLYPYLSNPEMSSLMVDHQLSSMTVRVEASDFVNNSSLQFQYFLEGYDEEWSPPLNLRSKEYTRIRPGEYTLHVRAVGLYGQVTEPKSLSVVIKRPWYTSSVARMIYVFLLIAIPVTVFFTNKKKYRSLEKRYDATLQQSEAKIASLEEKNMRAELAYKNRELVTSTMHLLKKNETLGEIADELSRLKKEAADKLIKKRISTIIRKLNQDKSVDGGWEELMYHFNEVHNGFFERLRNEYPELTPKDLKICAYLKMNLSSKEIANLMNISLRGVEAARYRLRRKLKLDSEVNLSEFLMTY